LAGRQVKDSKQGYKQIEVRPRMHANRVGTVAPPVKGKGWNRPTFKTQYGWKWEDQRGGDLLHEPIAGELAQYSWHNKVATVLHAADLKPTNQWVPRRSGAPFTQPREYVPRGGQVPRITDNVESDGATATPLGAQIDPETGKVGMGTVVTSLEAEKGQPGRTQFGGPLFVPGFSAEGGIETGLQPNRPGAGIEQPAGPAGPTGPTVLSGEGITVQADMTGLIQALHDNGNRTVQTIQNARASIGGGLDPRVAEIFERLGHLLPAMDVSVQRMAGIQERQARAMDTQFQRLTDDQRILHDRQQDLYNRQNQPPPPPPSIVLASPVAQQADERVLERLDALGRLLSNIENQMGKVAEVPATSRETMNNIHAQIDAYQLKQLEMLNTLIQAQGRGLDVNEQNLVAQERLMGQVANNVQRLIDAQGQGRLRPEDVNLLTEGINQRVGQGLQLIQQETGAIGRGTVANQQQLNQLQNAYKEDMAQLGQLLTAIPAYQQQHVQAVTQALITQGQTTDQLLGTVATLAASQNAQNVPQPNQQFIQNVTNYVANVYSTADVINPVPSHDPEVLLVEPGNVYPMITDGHEGLPGNGLQELGNGSGAPPQDQTVTPMLAIEDGSPLEEEDTPMFEEVSDPMGMVPYVAPNPEAAQRDHVPDRLRIQGGGSSIEPQPLGEARTGGPLAIEGPKGRLQIEGIPGGDTFSTYIQEPYPPAPSGKKATFASKQFVRDKPLIEQPSSFFTTKYTPQGLLEVTDLIGQRNMELFFALRKAYLSDSPTESVRRVASRIGVRRSAERTVTPSGTVSKGQRRKGQKKGIQQVPKTQRLKQLKQRKTRMRNVQPMESMEGVTYGGKRFFEPGSRTRVGTGLSIR
jgi:hypothetical protein